MSLVVTNPKRHPECERARAARKILQGVFMAGQNFVKVVI